MSTMEMAVANMRDTLTCTVRGCRRKGFKFSRLCDLSRHLRFRHKAHAKALNALLDAGAATPSKSSSAPTAAEPLEPVPPWRTSPPWHQPDAWPAMMALPRPAEALPAAVPAAEALPAAGDGEEGAAESQSEDGDDERAVPIVLDDSGSSSPAGSNDSSAPVARLQTSASLPLRELAPADEDSDSDSPLLRIVRDVPTVKAAPTPVSQAPSSSAAMGKGHSFGGAAPLPSSSSSSSSRLLPQPRAVLPPGDTNADLLRRPATPATKAPRAAPLKTTHAAPPAGASPKAKKPKLAVDMPPQHPPSPSSSSSSPVLRRRTSADPPAPKMPPPEEDEDDSSSDEPLRRPAAKAAVPAPKAKSSTTPTGSPPHAAKRQRLGDNGSKPPPGPGRPNAAPDKAPPDKAPPDKAAPKAAPKATKADAASWRAEFFARLLLEANEAPKAWPEKEAFPSEAAYFAHMAEVVIAEAKGCVQEGSEKNVAKSLGRLTEVHRQPTAVEGVESVTATMRSHGSLSGLHLQEGCLLRLQAPWNKGGPQPLAMLLSRPNDEDRELEFHFCVRTQDAPTNGWQLIHTDISVLVPLRAYLVCSARPKANMGPELLGTERAQPGGSRSRLVEATCGQKCWKVVAKFPVGVREEHNTEADECDKVWPGQELEVEEVWPEFGFHGCDESGAPVPAGSDAAVRYWLRLAEGGWLYSSKDIQGCKSMLAKPLGLDVERRRQPVPAKNDLRSVPKKLLDEQLQAMNPSQRRAVEHFLSTSQRLVLLQGPPGSGKSATLTRLLEIIVRGRLLGEQELLLVTGPTNKAVHHLASKAVLKVSRATDDSPWARSRLLLTGVAEELPELAEKQRKNSMAPLSLHDIHERRLQASMARRLAVAQERLHSAEAAGKAASTIGLVHHCLSLLCPTVSKAAELDSLLEMANGLEASGGSASAGLAGALKAAERRVAKLGEEKLQRECLRRCDLLFGTLATFGRNNLRKDVKTNSRTVRFVIVDEAAQPPEAETLLLLPWDPEKVLFVGDPQQLAATVVSRLGRQCGFDASLMARLIASGGSCGMLEEQYRMHPAISAFPSAFFYGGKLRDAAMFRQVPASSTLSSWSGQATAMPRYLVLDSVCSKEEPGRGESSLCNRLEASLALQAAEVLVPLLTSRRAKDPHCNGLVCLLTFYQGQAQLLRKGIAERPALAEAANEGQLLVHSVDSFQGCEAEAVVLSFVRTEALGFLRDERRLNVALTRAQRRLLVLANVAGLEAAAAKGRGPRPAALEMLADARRRGLLVAAGDFLASVGRN